MYCRIIVFFLCLLTTGQSPAQSSPDALALIREVNAKFARVKDYQAKAIVDVRISFMKILPQKAKVFYRRPDKFRVKSEGIAILPRQNLDQLFQLTANENEFMAFAIGDDAVQGVPVKVLNIVPVSDTSDLILAKIWVDPVKDLVLKSQLTTKTNGTILIEYTFGTQSAFALPDQAVFTIEVRKFKIPKAISADLNSAASKKDSGKEQKTGKIILRFSDYQINKGLADAVFVEK